ncbi:MAG: molybdopterin synthase sulfur carrier subunit [Chloroflexi bacterium]|jgi:molybdopterin synthase sulfur carrier subunit|nr:molybdopterin synthase sulfur carrier subunit [Chloroflexota bacterium]MCH2536693.1 MoaD/ThiS family protein [Dehalococcoidia bacterium]MEE2926482.1 MoaD/ThiS family protein [Chloroflexota bacterium]HIM48448.1 molybdopterin synthase sulfur carrier subunit [Dehalococcoidia bacterium]|tara:strand:+ start:1118 stop:1390 length:273 start_codon:yes stop_codon:yes gene_type:complete
MPDVWIPTLMQGLTGGNQVIQVEGATVRQIINNLELLYPGTKARLYDAEEDELLPGVAAVVDGDASQLGLMERVNPDSEVHFLPAIGGGG